MKKTNPGKLNVAGPNDPQQVRLSDRFGKAADKPDRDKFEWAGVDALLISEAVTKCVGGGDAIMFGITRDGGAGVISVLSGEDRQKFYPTNTDSANAALMQVSYAYSTFEQKREFPETFVPLSKLG